MSSKSNASSSHIGPSQYIKGKLLSPDPTQLLLSLFFSSSFSCFSSQSSSSSLFLALYILFSPLSLPSFLFLLILLFPFCLICSEFVFLSFTFLSERRPVVPFTSTSQTWLKVAGSEKEEEENDPERREAEEEEEEEEEQDVRTPTEKIIWKEPIARLYGGKKRDSFFSLSETARNFVLGGSSCMVLLHTT